MIAPARSGRAWHPWLRAGSVAHRLHARPWRRDGRADECAALEKPWGSGPRGFESHSLRALARRRAEGPSGGVRGRRGPERKDDVRTPESDAITAPSGGEAISDEAAMRLALAEAAAATSHGDVPVGAVALVGGTVVTSHHNERELRGDPTAHAELLAVRAAASALEEWRLEAVTIVVTLEPCAMCAGALIAARVGRLVFGAADPKAGACGSLYNLCCDPRLNYELPVTAGVLAGEAGGLLQDFFARRRGRGGTPGGGGATGAGAAPPGGHVARNR